ncbi:MAG TPA: nuclear transport factor 2 family protein [Longimicrobium sp.]|nr:nuclear transport factor 2 family protein [Longimicrobium sp.]
MYRHLLILIACVAVALGGRPLAAQSQAADSAAIHQASRDFSAAYVRGDAAAQAALYTPDAVIFPDRSEMITGREAIQAYWALRPGNRVTRHVATPTSIRVEGDLAYDYGVYEVSGERDGQPWGPSLGKYVIVWKRGEDGAWRMQLDMWNSRPQPRPSP